MGIAEEGLFVCSPCTRLGLMGEKEACKES